jgi:HK97 family phage portal protein
MDETKSLYEQMIISSKALGQGLAIPFQSYGTGYGTSQIFESEAAWDSYIDSQYGSVRNYQKYRLALGDLSRHPLPCAAIRFLGDSLGEAPLQVKKKSGAKSGHKEAEIIDDHKLTALWNRPNEYYSGATMLRGIAFSLILSGNGFILKNFNDLGPTASWPIELWWEPHWTIRPVWPINGAEFISYYEVNRQGTWYPVPIENVIHIRDGLHPYNQRVGWTGLDAILPELFGDSEAAAYYASLMGGSGVPNFMVAIDKEIKMTATQQDEFEKTLLAKTSGARKGQPLVAKGARAYKLGLSPHELDLRESRYMAEDRFCSVMGIPAVVLELGTGQAHSIYKNVEEAQERAWRNYVCPKLSMIEDELNIHLLPDFETDPNFYCEHDLSQIPALQEDVAKKATRLSNLFSKGAIMRSDLRKGLGLDSSIENDEEVDRVYFIPRGGTLIKADEFVLGQGEQIINMSTGEIRAGAPPPAPSPEFGGQPSKFDKEALQGLPSENQPEGQSTPEKPLLNIAKALYLPPAPENGSSNPQVADLSANGMLNPNVNWTPFPPYMDSLGIPRTSMPQVQSKHRGAMVQFLRGRGITHSVENIKPSDLKPTQAEYRPDKVELAKEFEGPERPILVSADNRVVDGHHQWMAALEDNPDEPISTIKLDSDITPLLLEVSRFPSSGVSDGDGNHKYWKAMPKGQAEITKADIDDTIKFLKTHRYGQALAMIEAKPWNGNGKEK